MGLRYAPFCFTEQGVTMLSCVLNSPLLEYKDILLKLEQIEKRLESHDEDIKILFTAMKKMLLTPDTGRKRIGYRRSNEKQ